MTWHGLHIETRRHEADIAPGSRAFDYAWWKASRFALVDPHRLDELPPGLPLQALCPPAFTSSAHLMPRLLDLHALLDDQRAWMLDELDRCVASQEQPAISVLLPSEASADDMARHLTRQQTVRQGASQAWLRLHDPYVFIQLARVLDGRGLRDLFGPVQQWIICLAGDWHSCTPRLAANDVALGAPSARPWDALLRIAAVNRCLLAKGWANLEEIAKRSPHIDLLVQRGQNAYRLSRPADAAAFAAMGADLRLEFDQHPLLTPLIDEWRAEGPEADGANLIDELQALPPEAWDRVRTDCALVS